LTTAGRLKQRRYEALEVLCLGLWTELFKKSAKTVEEHSIPLLGVDRATFQNAIKGIKSLDLYLEDYDAWVNISKKVKILMEKGVINFDVIKDETLLLLLIMETANLEQLSVLFKKKEKEE
jgi:hypothetical protein